MAWIPRERAVMTANRGQRGGLLSRLVGVAFVLAVFATIVLIRYPLMAAVGRWLIVSDSPQRSDAIVVLSGDDVQGDRAARAALLYKEDWAPIVVASGSQIRSYLSESDLTARDLTQDGVPSNAIVRFPQTDLYTLAEARDLLGLCHSRHWQRILVVTSNYHTRRSRYIFRSVFPSTMDVRLLPANDSGYDPGGWWLTRRGAKTLVREYAALLVSFWEIHSVNHPG